jgi:hypothetical protein
MVRRKLVGPVHRMSTNRAPTPTASSGVKGSLSATLNTMSTSSCIAWSISLWESGKYVLELIR